MIRDILKKSLASLLAVSVISVSGIVSYAAGNNVVDIRTYVNDTVTDTVFVGETAKTVLAFENMANYKGYSIGIKYNKDVIQLSGFTGSESYVDFENNNVGISFTEYGTNALKKTKSIVIPNHGVILSARTVKNADIVPVTELTDVMNIEFVALAEGMSGFSYVNPSVDGDLIFDICNEDIGIRNEDYCKFPDLTVTKNTQNFKVLEKPEAPTNAKWGDDDTPEQFVVSWEAPATDNRGYIVSVSVDGEFKENIETTETSIDLIETIEKYEIGAYDVTVVAKGGTYNSDPSNVASKQINQLPLVLDGVEFDEETKKLTWNAVANADEYVIVVNKDGVTDPVTTITITDPTTVEQALEDEICVGDYTISITAKSDSGLYADAFVEKRYLSGSTITCTINPVLHSSNAFEPNPAHTAKITLYGDGVYYSDTDADGDGIYTITGVPAYSEGYTVEIERVSTVTRTFTEKLVLTSSIEKDLGKDGQALTLYAGDVERVITENQVDIDDVSKVVDVVGSMTGDPEFEISDDLDGDETITTRDVSIVLYNFWKGARSYRPLTDYDFTINN